MSNNSNYKSKIQFKQKNCDKPHIYKITNLINQKYYYGVHDGSDTQNYEGSGLLLKQAYEKYGKENFIKEILLWFDTEDEAYEYEEIIVNEKMINKNNPMCYNLCVGGHGGDTFSCQTPERQEEIRQKCSGENNAMFGQNPFEGKSEKEIEEINQKQRDWYQNLSEEKKQDIKQKQIDFAKKQWENRTPEQKAAISQKKSETWDNRSEEEKEKIRQKKSEAATKQWEDMSPEKKAEVSQNMSEAAIKMWDNKSEEEKEAIRQKQSEANKGEKNGTKTMFQHPYNPNFKGNSNKISNDIRKNYPNEKQWNQLTIKERQSYKIVSPELRRLIAN